MNIDVILKEMTLEEKASLCSGKDSWHTKPVERLDIPEIMVSDGPHGLRKVKDESAAMNQAIDAVCFPTACATACSFDRELVANMGKALGQACKAEKVAVLLGPGCNIKRSPLCGRNFEYFSEDPYLAAKMGAGWVHGVQKENVGTSLKHFVANNQEHIRMSISSIVDERALREIYMPAFEYIVKTEQPTTVMCSYNQLNEVFLSDNKRMLTDVLRDEWGFKGIVVSDWGAVNNRVEGIRAGLDLEMPGNNGLNDRHIVAAVKNGTLKEEELDRVVLRMIKFAIENKAREVDYKVDLDANHEIARKASASSAVLLKNEDDTLPLKKSEKIAVIGQMAKHARFQGAGSSHIGCTKITSFTDMLDEMKQPYEYADGYTLKGDGLSKKLIKEACRIAEGKDKVLLFIGLTDAYESEGYDRTHINLPEAHNILANELLKVNKNVVVVLSVGAPVKLGEWEKGVKSILNMYIGGQAVGAATYDLLYGAVNPSGKLAETYPFHNHDNIVANYFSMGPKTVEYRESVYVGYRYFDKVQKPVRYPFGFGLSYTTFEYSGFRLSADKIKETDTLTVSFKIKNTGKVAGAEIAQLYVSDVESTIFRPVKELKGFKKVFLNPGEEKTVELALDSRAFAYYNVLIHDWHVESGDFKILIGASSQDIKLEGKVFVESANPDAPIPDYRKSAPFYYELTGKDTEIPKEQFEVLYGAKLPNNDKFKKGELTKNCSLAQCAVSPWGRFIYKAANLGSHIIAKNSENPEMIIESVKDIPLRYTSTMTGGIVSEYSLQGLVKMVNGKRGGFCQLLRGFRKKYKAIIIDD